MERNKQSADVLAFQRLHGVPAVPLAETGLLRWDNEATLTIATIGI